ncbi:uncharacterized protein N7482_010026 [Penicillium canariense]|uniref:Uncharacterized protein n=1 Tax=Penicillium canariense TaxID=189055 RepID=A0A9W9LGF2_9EURO|nr:uncharacterized protein N7482_010026 [Penicillium canariense]KAJ5153548.1 hypothetical protein N7482_010026 [Penicillium canariense]
MSFSIRLQVSILILALYPLGIQAASVPKLKQVSVLDLLGNSTKIIESGNVTQKHSLPEIDESNFHVTDGIKFYNYPGGIDVPSEFWEERSIVKNDTGSDLEARYYTPQCLEACSCSSEWTTSYSWETVSYSTVAGNLHKISDPLCPPGSISNSYTLSYSYQLSVQAGPDLKIPIKYLDKFGLRAGFSYTWGHAQTTAYTVSWTDSTHLHPFIETFRPNVFIASGIARMIKSDLRYGSGKVCSTSAPSHINVHLPLVYGSNDDCQSSGSTCGASGNYDSCFFVGNYAKALCPNRNLGPTPYDRECPSYLY